MTSSEDQPTIDHDEAEGRETRGHSGEEKHAATPAAATVEDADLDALDVDDRQDKLLDEGVEETFPASDPISVKRIT